MITIDRNISELLQIVNRNIILIVVLFLGVLLYDIYMFIYTYICVCMCVCVYFKESNKSVLASWLVMIAFFLSVWLNRLCPVRLPVPHVRN